MLEHESSAHPSPSSGSRVSSDEPLLAGSSKRLGFYVWIIKTAIHQSIDPIGHTIASYRDQRHPLVFSRLKPHRGSSRNLQSKPIGLLTIEPQRAIRLEEMTMRPDLNRPITGIGNNQLNRLTAFERNNVALTEDDFTRNDRGRLERSLLFGLRTLFAS